MTNRTPFLQPSLSKIKYCEHAPKILIELFESMICASKEDQNRDQDPDANSAAWHKTMLYLASKSKIQIERNGKPIVFYAKSELPDCEAFPLLEALLVTSPDMAKAWETISKLNDALNDGADSDTNSLAMWRVCHDSILEYNRGSNLTPRDHKTQYKEIANLALELSSRMGQADYFGDRSNFSPNVFFWPNGIDAILDHVNSETESEERREDREKTFFLLLNHYVCDHDVVLKKIADTANQVADRKPRLAKAFAKKADVHRVILALSKHFRRTYGKPLHGTVAAIATALFGYKRGIISESAVGHLVRGK